MKPGDRRTWRSATWTSGATTSWSSSSTPGNAGQLPHPSARGVPEQPLRGLRHRLGGRLPRRQAAPLPGPVRRRTALSNPAWLRLLNVRYLVTPQPLAATPPVICRLVHQGSRRGLREPGRAAARTVRGRMRVVAPRARDPRLGEQLRRDAAGFTWLEDPGIPPVGRHGGATRDDRRPTGSTICAVDVEHAGARAAARSPTCGIRTGPPPWTGAAPDVLKADYLLRAVAVPAGAAPRRVPLRIDGGAHAGSRSRSPS